MHEAHRHRRIFLKSPNADSVYLFRLSQNKRDGSVYFSPPGELKIVEINPDTTNQAIVINSDRGAHVSIHGSGQAHYRESSEPYSLPINGQHLLKPATNEISVRHIFSCVISKPQIATFASRKSDYIIHSSRELSPFALVAFAIPRLGLKINFRPHFDIYDLEDVPNDLLGVDIFPLVHHDILFFAYRTKYMEAWPKETHLQYLDGVHIPLFIGSAPNEFKIEVRQTIFELKDKTLSIVL